MLVVGLCAECTAEEASRYMAPHNTLRFDSYHHAYRVAVCQGCGVHWFDERGQRSHNLPSYTHPATWTSDGQALRDGIDRVCRWCVLGSPHSPIWS